MNLKILLWLACLCLTASLASAVTCPNPTLAPGTFPVGACTYGDKVFDNFTFSEPFPSNASVRIQPDATSQAFTVSLFGAFRHDFTFSYMVSFTDACASCVFKDVQTDLTALRGLPVVTAQVNGVSPVVVNPLSGPLVSTLPAGVQSILVTNVYTAAGGLGTNISNVIQTGFMSQDVVVPEPLTLALTGAGLIGLGLIRRLRRG